MQMVAAVTKLKDICSSKKSYDKSRQDIKKQRHYFADKSSSSQSYDFPSSHVQMWELDHKEVRALKNWCFLTVVLENTLESPLNSKEIKPVNLKGDQPSTFTGRTDAEDETLIFWSSDGNIWLIGKSLILGKIEGRKRRHQRMRWLDGINNVMNVNLGEFQEMWGTGWPGMLQSQRVRHDWVTEKQQQLQKRWSQF